MIEVTIYNHLKTALNIPVYTEYPVNANELDEFVVVSKIDGGVMDHIKAATILCEIYADGMYNCAALAEIVKEKMFEATMLDDISAVKLGSDRPNNDLVRKEYKYECIFNLFHY